MIAGVTNERPSRAVWLSEVVRLVGCPEQSLFLFPRPNLLCELRYAVNNRHVVAHEVLTERLEASALASDSGQSASACPSAPQHNPSGTTLMYGDCHAVFSISDKTTVNRASWTFNWTAPPAGAGPLLLYLGAVDGDCKMDSLGDDVKMSRVPLAEATAARAPSRRPYAFALLLILPIWMFYRRRRRGED